MGSKMAFQGIKRSHLDIFS